jgi:hypothetical protein
MIDQTHHDTDLHQIDAIQQHILQDTSYQLSHQRCRPFDDNGRLTTRNIYYSSYIFLAEIGGKPSDPTLPRSHAAPMSATSDYDRSFAFFSYTDGMYQVIYKWLD